MPQMSLTGTVSYAPESVSCDLKVDDVATEEYRNYLTRTARRGAWMVVRDGKHGKFYGCSRYPKCEKTKSLKESEGDTEQ